MADSLETTSAIDLVERLRTYAVPWRDHGWTDEATAITEAADTITRLQADRELTLELLDALTNDDHKRLCEGRQYSCTCGYDEKVAELANLLALKFDRSSVGGE